MFVLILTNPTSLLRDLFAGYRVVGLTVPITMEEFLRNADKRAMARATVEERLEGIPAEEMRKRMTPEECLEGITPEQILANLTPEAREAFRRSLNQPPTP